jgi:hypothetical protein
MASQRLLTYHIFSGKCMIGLFKPGSSRDLDSSNLSSGSRSRSSHHVNLGMFLDTDDAQDSDQSQVHRSVSVTSSFAESAAMTFEASVFESRIVCLRQIMKCIVSTELSKDPMQSIESIHQQQSTMVLEIVQVLYFNFSTFNVLSDIGLIFVSHRYSNLAAESAFDV